MIETGCLVVGKQGGDIDKFFGLYQVAGIFGDSTTITGIKIDSPILIYEYQNRSNFLKGNIADFYMFLGEYEEGYKKVQLVESNCRIANSNLYGSSYVRINFPQQILTGGIYHNDVSNLYIYIHGEENITNYYFNLPNNIIQIQTEPYIHVIGYNNQNSGNDLFDADFRQRGEDYNFAKQISDTLKISFNLDKYGVQNQNLYLEQPGDGYFLIKPYVAPITLK